METTKRRHFDYLGVLESARKNQDRAPTEHEQAMLAQLLRDHDDQVKLFAEASAALKAADGEAFAALWEYIGEINRALGIGEAH